MGVLVVDFAETVKRVAFRYASAQQRVPSISRAVGPSDIGEVPADLDLILPRPRAPSADLTDHRGAGWHSETRAPTAAPQTARRASGAQHYDKSLAWRPILGAHLASSL